MLLSIFRWLLLGAIQYLHIFMLPFWIWNKSNETNNWKYVIIVREFWIIGCSSIMCINFRIVPFFKWRCILMWLATRHVFKAHYYYFWWILFVRITIPVIFSKVITNHMIVQWTNTFKLDLMPFLKLFYYLFWILCNNLTDFIVCRDI